MKPVKDTKALPVVRFIDEIAGIFGYPERLISDRGSCFTSKRIEKFCRELNTKHVFTAVATPRANGQVERYNCTILGALNASYTDENKWDREVNKIRHALNNTFNKSIGKTPREVLLGYKPRHKAETPLLNEVA